MTTSDFPLHSVKHERGSRDGWGRVRGLALSPTGRHPPPPSAPPPPAAPADEEARLGRRKLTVSGFDPRPRKETAPKKTSQQDSGPDVVEQAAPGAF